MTNQSIATNANNDIYQDSTGNLAILTGVAALAQDATHMMSAQLGEMIYQPLDGLPNFQDVWLQKNLIKWEAAARARLLQIVGITSIVSFTYQQTGNTLNYQATLTTVYDTNINISGTV